MPVFRVSPYEVLTLPGSLSPEISLVSLFVSKGFRVKVVCVFFLKSLSFSKGGLRL